MTPKGDHRKILLTLRRALQKRCVQTLCQKSKIGSTTFYSATHPTSGNPSLRTLCRIINALGYQLYVKRKKGAAGPPEPPKVAPAEAV